MIDTIHIFLSSDFISDNYNIADNNLVTNIQETITQDTGEITAHGSLQNLRLRKSTRGLSVKGSLPKYYLNTNQKTLNQNDIEKAFAKLSQDLNLPLLEARVNRLDLAENIIINKWVDEYLPLLGNARYFNRLEMNSGLGYENVNRYISFYDKVKEVKRKKVETLQQIFQNRNVVRYEYRLNQPAALTRCLKITKVFVKDILAKYPLLVNEWYAIFFTINKNKKAVEFDTSIFKTKGAYDKQMSLMGIEKIGGLQAVISHIKAARKAKVFRYPNEPTNLLNKYIAIMNNPILTQRHDLVEELETKIRIGHFVNSISGNVEKLQF